MGNKICSIYNTRSVFRNIEILHVRMIKLTHCLCGHRGFWRFLLFWACFAIIFGVLAETMAPKVFFHLTQKIFKFFLTLLVCVHVSDQAFMVISPHIAAMAYKYRRLVLTGETPFKSQNS